MTQKLLGAGLVFAGCSAAGFAKAFTYKRTQRLTEETLAMIRWMKQELSYKAYDIYTLCRGIKSVSAELGSLYEDMSALLEQGKESSVLEAMESAVSGRPGIPQAVTVYHIRLARTLGRYDLEGQLNELNALELSCGQALDRLRNRKDDMLKVYHILGVCAGAALALMLL